MKPQITIIIATLNASQTLRRCLNSIINQTYPNKELIIMDGASTDNTLPILNDYKKHITYLESQPDKGIYHAWNKAIKHSKGKWICFLGADDFFWSNSALSDLIPYLNKANASDIKLVYGQMAKVDLTGSIVKIRGKSWDKIRWQMYHGMPAELPHPGLMHHRNLFKIHGLFDETFNIAGDYDFLLRELKKHKAMYAPEIRTIGSQIGGIADTANLDTFKEVARARKKNGFSGFSWLWVLVYGRGLFKLIVPILRTFYS